MNAAITELFGEPAYKSVFASQREIAYPFRFAGQLHADIIVAGIPADQRKIEGWLRTKVVPDRDQLIQRAVAETMLDLSVERDEAVDKVAALQHLNVFKRGERGLYIEGRQLKAALKEAAMVAAGAGQLKSGKVWGATNKGLFAYFAEHVFVVEDRLYLGKTEPEPEPLLTFPKSRYGTGIQYEEIVKDALIEFTVITDHDFS
jgi:hypothetical protein